MSSEPTGVRSRLDHELHIGDIVLFRRGSVYILREFCDCIECHNCPRDRRVGITPIHQKDWPPEEQTLSFVYNREVEKLPSTKLMDAARKRIREDEAATL